MLTFEEIRNVLAPELSATNSIMRNALKADNELMDSIVDYYLTVKGKQIRPLMVILCAKMFGQINDHVLHAAASLELLHNASLIHDDIVDDTMKRRNVATINAHWGNHIAVLVGDFFVSNSLAIGVATNNIEIIRTISHLGRELSLGEINQICNVRDHSLDEQRYINMISQKTASLFLCCAKLGAEAVGVSPDVYLPLTRFAEKLGICFQIKDDIFDYYSDSNIGKPTGNDLREGKVTLPLLFAVNNTHSPEAETIKNILSKSELSTEEIDTCIKFAKDNGGIDYAYKKMNEICDEADRFIDSYPESETRDALKSLLRHIVSRKY